MHPIHTSVNLAIDEQNIIKEISNGNTDAFREIYRLYYKSLCQFVYKYFEDRDEAEDIVQETLVGIWEKRNNLNISNLRTYLFSSVKNACLNKIKHMKIVEKYTDTNLIELKIIELEHDNLFEETEEYFIAARVEHLLSTLPDQRRKIMSMKYQEGLSAKEIAEITNTSQRTVETHIYKGIKAIQNIFNKTIVTTAILFFAEQVRILFKMIVF